MWSSRASSELLFEARVCSQTIATKIPYLLLNNNSSCLCMMYMKGIPGFLVQMWCEEATVQKIMDAEYIPHLVHWLSRPSTSCLHTMPWRTNLHPIHQHYSRDLKKHVVYQAFTLDKTTTQIAIDLDMPLRVVQSVLQNWREIGEVCKDRWCLGHAPLLSREAVTVSANHPELSCVLNLTCCMCSSSCLCCLIVTLIFSLMRFKTS